MDNLFIIIFLLSFISLITFGVIWIINVIKKDKLKSKKGLRNTSISLAVLVVSFIVLGFSGEPDESKQQANKNEVIPKEVEEKEEEPEKVETIAEEVEEEPELTQEEIADKEAEEKEQAELKAKQEEEAKAKKEAEEKAKAEEESVPREHKSALKKAETYAETMHMSKAGIYDQLTSEYGEGFPAEAAQYAIDNIIFDWNESALKKAQTYAETMSMSDSAVYDQLISEYGEKFTAEEAQYAIDNLE